MKEEPPIGSNTGDEKAFRVAYLVAGFLRKSLTDAEDIELDDWVNESTENLHLFEKLIEKKNLDEWVHVQNNVQAGEALEKIKQNISFSPDKKRSAVRSLWVYAAAATVIAAIMFTILVNSKNKPPKLPDMVQSKPADINPGKDRATLTLSDGKFVVLDTLQNGNLGKQGSVHITKLDSGQLAYESVHPTMLPQAELYNTLTIPAGGQFKLVLPDGTKVWLNASSSLKYPTVFGGAKRRVQLTGEGYFEVAKDPMFPFEVTANGSTILVLGTHFNINAYSDEPVLRVTLAEGSIKLNNSMLLKRGEEASVAKNGNILKSKADLETTLAWTNGQFIFKEMPIDILMRQVSRWYNAGIIYDATITKHFNAAIPRDVPVSKLLHLLEATGEVHFTITDKQITVMK